MRSGEMSIIGICATVWRRRALYGKKLQSYQAKLTAIEVYFTSFILFPLVVGRSAVFERAPLLPRPITGVTLSAESPRISNFEEQQHPKSRPSCVVWTERAICSFPLTLYLFDVFSSFLVDYVPLQWRRRSGATAHASRQHAWMKHAPTTRAEMDKPIKIDVIGLKWGQLTVAVVVYFLQTCIPLLASWSNFFLLFSSFCGRWLRGI